MTDAGFATERNVSDDGENQIGNRRIAHIDLDERSLARATADIEHERKVAIYDLLEENFFEPVGAGEGPFELYLSYVENRLVFDVRRHGGANTGGEALGQVHLSMTPFRKIIKDYFMLCESYYDAIRTAAPAQIETIDMARRSLHNEGSDILRERLNDKINLDLNTARRLFTLICSFYMR
ncbi:MAG: UPF0262 family protein [Parvularculaceae bacterium]|nr:UPF0262 family protein [Parvularculaceae bacterium]